MLQKKTDISDLFLQDLTKIKEDDPADQEKMNIGVQNLKNWLNNVPIAARSVTDFADNDDSKNDFSSFWSALSNAFVNHVYVNCEFTHWLSSKLDLFTEGWNDNDDEKDPDLHNVWERCDLVLQIVFSRFSVDSHAKKLIQKVIVYDGSNIGLTPIDVFLVVMSQQESVWVDDWKIYEAKKTEQSDDDDNE